jgi:UDP-glucose 4-epimerase
VPRRQGDLAEYYADPSLAEKMLQWKTSFDIKAMCEDTWNWQKYKIKA